LDPDGGEYRCPSASSPSRSIPEVRFLRVLVSMNIGSLIRVKVFDQAVSASHGTAGPRPYQCSPKLLSFGCLLGSPPGVRIKIINTSMASNQHISAYIWSLH
jgi:hypothetical protein